MDEVMWIVGIGLVLTGVLIGYPLGHVGGKREAYRQICPDTEPQIIRRCRRRLERADILNAEILEVKEK